MYLSNESAQKETNKQKTWESPLFTRADAAAYLNVRKSTLEAWAHRGGGPSFVKMGRTVRYRRSDLDAFIESNIRQNTCEA